MSKEKIFTDVLTKKYRHEDFLHFAAEFFTGMNSTAPNLPQSPPASFAEHVKEYFVIGTYSADAEQILILAVNLNENKSVEYSRSAQRNFVKAIMGDNDAVIAAFYSDAAPEKWRLSFVQIDSTFTPDGLKTTITPANRSSFLVGENEPVNTARAQLFPLFADDENLPTKNDLTEAFGVERVTQKFFDEYRNKYFELRELLKKNPDFQAAKKNFNAEQFAKKLLGQIVFLYFLQKKGWLGVDKNSPWGSGHVKFVQKTFDDCARDGKNFFREVLEPLFYTALNDERPDDFYTPLGTRIPFLNGGLFEPLDEHWRDHDFKLGNEIFSDGENGILDIFNRYNFTICEDAPKEHEVAVDPEMLGKIFENLLESGDRKVKGAFYTPREIVSRMCREALTDYLVERTKIPAEAVTEFLLHGEEFRDDDAENLRTGRPLKLNAEIFNRRAEIDNLLKNVKVADPAVGSGAFPLGMLIEIVTARDVLTTYLRADENFSEQDRRPYALKCDTIKNCIFACDIEPSAVDIAKLRLWLSIVIDDAPRPDEKNFKPHRLPNLDCNIICGNSLIDAFEGVPLLKTGKFFGNLGTDRTEGNLFYTDAKFDADIEELIDLHDKLFSESDFDCKKNLRDDIKKIYDKIVTAQIKDKSFVKKYREAAEKNSLPFVLWQLYFPTVFKGGGAFDIVIGNPPYVDSETMTKTMPELRKIYADNFKSAKGNWDLYVVFIERGLFITRNGGQLSLIVPNKIISAPYAETIRKILAENQLQEFRDYSSVNVFKKAAVYPVVFRMKKTADKKSVAMRVMKNILETESELLIDEKTFYSDTSWNKYFDCNAESLSVIQKMNQFPLMETQATVKGAATVNEAYLIKDFVHDATSDEKNFLKFVNTGGIDKYKSFHGKGNIRYLKSNYSCPVVSVADLKNMSERRLNESLSEKIIIGGMNKTIECFYDSGEYLAGKSTTIVYGASHLKFITAILNSNLMSFYYQKVFGAMSLSGGFYRIGVPQIKMLPIAIPKNQATIDAVEAKVDELQSLYLTNDNNDRAEKIFSELDETIYKLYGLTADEISYLKNFELEFRMSD